MVDVGGTAVKRRHGNADNARVPMTAETYDPIVEEQLTAARGRQVRGLVGREALGRGLMLALFLGAAFPLAAFAHSHRSPPWWIYLGFVVAYAVSASIHIEVGSGLALPTEIVFVPMLFVLPPGSVPLVVALGLVAQAVPSVAAGRLSPARAAVLPGNALFALAPAAVMIAAGEPRADWHGGAIVACAVVAQFAGDFAASSMLEWVALGVRPAELVHPMALTFAIDGLVTPIAYLVAVAARVERGALLLPIPLVVLLDLFARERRRRLDSVVELSSAYRGTAFLLGDVIEADDAYTGDHSRQVVDLVAGVCEVLGLAPRDARIAELSALLHDVGKIRIPPAIINKPGPLDPEERALIETHTIEGEALLQQVGGLLADVGAIVRSCHERWDGRGYPDGLAGEEIPLVARVICCCDAFNAMTTDRPYRKALSREAALAELRANRGTQFDPGVVDALLALEARTGIV